MWDEVTAAGQNDTASQQLASVSWAQRVEIGAVAPEVAAWDLGKGESEVLSLALKTPDCAALVDDRAARRCSQVLGIITLGTGGLLLKRETTWTDSFSSASQSNREIPVNLEYDDEF